MTALLLLVPSTPMLFMGQEFAASAPFHYFADHGPELAGKVRRGRAEFLAQFRSIATRETRSKLPDPAAPATFERCKLDHAERERHREVYELHRDLLRLRREDAVFNAQEPRALDGAVLGPEAFVLRYFGVEVGRPPARRQLRRGPEPQPRARASARAARGEGLARRLVERRLRLRRDGDAAA